MAGSRARRHRDRCGLGAWAAIANRLAGEGAAVVCTDVTGAAEGTAEELGELGWAVRVDVADDGEVARLLAEVRGRYGRLDALFNCAGGRWRGAAADGALRGELRAVMRVNLKGPFLMMKHAIPLMVQGGGGAVVNVSATLAVAAAPGFAHFAAAKAGLLQLTRTAALEYGPSGVRVNAICPSVIDTPTFRATMAGMPEGVLDGVLRRQGIRRLARAEEVAAAAVASLASRSGSAVDLERARATARALRHSTCAATSSLSAAAASAISLSRSASSSRPPTAKITSASMAAWIDSAPPFSPIRWSAW
jgi:NAD(P)-dependent dehydrogenase (short-subunit alcohol dehydrogenase family)